MNGLTRLKHIIIGVVASLAALLIVPTIATAAMLFSDPVNELPDPVITNSQTPHNASYVAANVFDNDVSGASNDAGNGYATTSAGGGTSNDAFIEFDFGVVTALDGFVFYQRGNNNDTVFNFDLIFSNNSDLSSPVGTLNFATNGSGDFLLLGDNPTNGMPQRQEFQFPASINARYVRWDVNSAQSVFEGASEMEFWAFAAVVPESDALAMFAIGACIAIRLGIGRRRRRVAVLRWRSHGAGS